MGTYTASNAWLMGLEGWCLLVLYAFWLWHRETRLSARRPSMLLDTLPLGVLLGAFALVATVLHGGFSG
jgi:hypothetical protein